MKSLADELPREVARFVHPDWRKNESAYWSQRDSLLDSYEGQWIGFADGVVVATGSSPVAVFHDAENAACHPFVTCVGREDQPIRMRRSSFAYDVTYPVEPLPVLCVEFRGTSGRTGPAFDDVIADTGADATALPWTDCQAIPLDPTHGRPVQMTGIAGGAAMSLLFQAWVVLDGREIPCRLQADFVGNERILGRDVLNQLRVVFDGPKREITVDS